MKLILSILTKIFILSACLVNPSFSQNSTKSKEPYKASNGHIFKVGDKIIIATPTDFDNSYESISDGLLLPQKLLAKEYFPPSTLFPSGTNVDRRFSSETIKYFKITEDKEIYAITDKLLNRSVNLEKAIKSSEIVSGAFLSSLKKLTNAIYLSDSLAYLEMLKKQKKVDVNEIKEFIYLFENNKYKKIREDEFEFNKEINIKKKLIETEINKPEESDTFRFILEVKFGNYDFEKGGFPLEINKSNKYNLLNDIWKFTTPEDINKQKVSLTNLSISYSNIDKFNFFKIDENRANILVKHLKDNFGNVNRTAFMHTYMIYENLENIKKDKYEYSFIDEDVNIVFKILSANVYNDADGYNWLSEIK